MGKFCSKLQGGGEETRAESELLSSAPAVCVRDEDATVTACEDHSRHFMPF